MNNATEHIISSLLCSGVVLNNSKLVFPRDRQIRLALTLPASPKRIIELNLSNSHISAVAKSSRQRAVLIPINKSRPFIYLAVRLHISEHRAPCSGSVHLSCHGHGRHHELHLGQCLRCRDEGWANALAMVECDGHACDCESYIANEHEQPEWKCKWGW